MTGFDAPLADTRKSIKSTRGQSTSVRIDDVSCEWKLMAYCRTVLQYDKGEIEHKNEKGQS